MKSVLKALMAASMLMPIAAQAQEVGDRGPGGPGGPGRRGDWNAPGGPRPDRGRPPVSAEVGVDAQIRAERPQWRGERPGGPEGAPWRGDRPDRQPGQDARPGGDHRPDWRGADRPDQRAEQRPDPRFERRPDWQRPDRPDRPPVIGNDDRRGWDQRRDDDRRRDWDRQQRERRDWDRAQTDRRWIDDRVRAQGGAWDRGWNDRGRYDRRNGWDRQWRNDGRYDWSRYRALNRGAYRLPRYYAPSGWGYGYRRFGIGVSLAPILFSQSYWIDDPFAYRLPEAYGPYRWVRYYDDALLVDIRTGQVVDTVYDIFF